MRAIQITQFGGPEVLTLADVPDPTVGGGQILIHVDRAGVNYADTHQAENSYLSPSNLPMVVGGEVVGRTDNGRRVVALLDGGGYAELAAAHEMMTFDVPDHVDDTAALAMIVQGVTAWLLLRKSTHMESGESVVVHAGAGGVGSIAIQLAKYWGAGKVIATASNETKRQVTLDLGADVAVDSAAPDMTAALREANGGKRVDVVLDMTGGRVTDQSLTALAPFGRLAFYGQASRQQPTAVKLPSLLSHSTTIAGMWLPHAFTLPDQPVPRALTELFTLIAEGKLRVIDGGIYALADARKAHEDIRSRATTGKLTLDPRV